MAEHRRDDYDSDRAWGRDGYVREGLSDAMGGLGTALHGVVRVLGIVAIIACIGVGLHVIPAVMSYSNPPVSCQILGGHWSFWDGWQCG